MDHCIVANGREASGRQQQDYEQQQGNSIQEPSCNSHDDGLDLDNNLNDTGKWPFPFLNEDLCCYYDSMDVATEEESSSDLPRGVVQQEQKNATSATIYFNPFCSNFAPPFFATCLSVMPMFSNTNSYSVLKNIYRVLKQYRNIVMVGCLLVIAVFSSTALVDNSGGRRQVALSVTRDADDNNTRMNMIKKNILDSKVSYDGTFDDDDSPQSLALEWISKIDPLRLVPSDDYLLQRYACAVFYFSIIEKKEIVDEEFMLRQTFQDWLTQKPVCQWSGITCDNDENGNITSFAIKTEKAVQGHHQELVREILIALPELQILQLNNLGLKRGIPSEIGLLSKLKILSLGNNKLSGNLPKSLGQLKQLTLLGLQNNLFHNEIPKEIWNLKELHALYLDGNLLTGRLPLEVENLKNMVDFRLRDNRMNGSLPPSLGSLTGLRILYVDNNNFHGTIPREIGNMRELESLTLHDNNFVSSLPNDLGNLRNLKHLVVSKNTLTGTIPTNVVQLPTLKYLWLDHNYLVGNVPNETCQRMKDGDIHLQIDCHSIACECCAECTSDNEQKV